MEYRQELGQRNKNLDQLGIFANNLVPSLEMFIPAAGLIIGTYSAVSTTSIQCICTGKSRFEINFSTQSVNLSFCNNGNIHAIRIMVGDREIWIYN
jgi:hypothetical protein